MMMGASTKARRRSVAAVRAVPRDRLLVESDVHSTRETPAGTAGAVAYLAAALGEPLERIADETAHNGRAFLERVMGNND